MWHCFKILFWSLCLVWIYKNHYVSEVGSISGEQNVKENLRPWFDDSSTDGHNAMWFLSYPLHLKTKRELIFEK
jgi:hypothetical protein